MPARRRQQAEIDKARSRLAEYRGRYSAEVEARADDVQRSILDAYQSEISRIERGQISPTLDTLTRSMAPLGVRLAIVDANGRPVPA